MASGKPKELSELAEYGAIPTFDTNQPLPRYIGAIRQMIKEAKVYQEEQDYDKAFVYSLKVVTLTKDLLPNRHPDWYTLPPSSKMQLSRDTEQVQANLSELKAIIYKRNEAWTKSSHSTSSRNSSTPTSKSPAPVIPRSAPALSLRNTVQPASLTMTSTEYILTKSELVLQTLEPPIQKTGRARKLARRFGMGKSRDVIAPTTATIVEGEEFSSKKVIMEEEIDEDWTLMARSSSNREEEGLRRAKTEGGDRHARPPRENRMPLPGEGGDESDEGSHVSNPRSSITSYMNRGSSSTSLNSLRSLHSALPQPSAPPPLPNQIWNPPSQAISYHSSPGTPPLYPQPNLNPSYPNYQQPTRGQLQRTPSRLTISHQQQQGYYPSPYYPPSFPYPSNTIAAVTQYPSTQILQPTYPNHSQQQQYSSSSSSNYSPQSITPPQYWNPPNPTLARPQAPSWPPAPVPPQSGLHSHSSHESLIPAQRSASATSAIVVPASRAPSGPRLVRSGSIASLPAGLIKPQWTKAREKDRGSEKFAIAEEVEEELRKTEGGYPLRNLIIPTDLVSQFVAIAMSNTDAGIETCGLLMGTLSHNTFSITHLLVPKQCGSTDTCTTTHEEEQFAFQDARDLMTLGWIHTHPTQSCFMSSLDLHTHASYQVMLAEAVAIVCSPRHEPGFGIFRLTDPPGLETIVKCDTKGLFHPHPDAPLYTDCDHGHVQLRKSARFECHDLRSG